MPQSFKIIRLTPAGRGAVAVFLLTNCFTNPVFLRYWKGKIPGKTPTWGRLQINETGDCEEAVVHLTADNDLEIHIHGGERIAAAIETLFQRAGAIKKTWQEHCAQDDSQRERALRQLPFAPTERTVQILLDQYNGAYERAAAEIERLPPEEQLHHRRRLAELEPLGKHLVVPFQAVLAGASNAGKSSLLNAILGFQRSIVNVQPGTTRDIVSGQTALAGFPVTFFDTAGFRESDDDLERQGIARSLKSLADADLIVWLIDPTVEESQRPPCPEGENVLLCWNKRDLLHTLPPFALKHLPKQSVSAQTGEGIEELLEVIVHRLIPTQPELGEAVPL